MPVSFPVMHKEMQIMEGFYTIAEFLRVYNIGRTTLYRTLKSDSELKLTKLGRASRIAKSDALAWAASLPKIGGGA